MASDGKPIGSGCRVVRVSAACPRSAVAEAARVVAAGGVVAFPTETVYGLGAQVDGQDALGKLFELKGRDRSKPIAVLLSRFDLVERFAREVSPLGRRLAAAFCPGPITLVLPGRSEGTVGVRVPDHEVALALIRACGGAIYATSANASGRPPARSAEDVVASFPTGVDLVLDAGPAPLGAPSTVVRVDRDRYTILRPGAIGAREIEAALRA